MKPIAVFHHSVFVGRHRPIDIRFSCWLMGEQMRALVESGLAQAATEIHICVNGDESDVDVARMFAPTKSVFHSNGREANSEIPTMNLMADWARKHPDWYVCYFHTKGASHPDQPNTTWRLAMEKYVIWSWRTCVYDLERGFDACGCYWLTPEEHKNVIKTPFFGGTMWWANAVYLTELPPLPADTFENRYDAEGWIGSRIPRPRVQSYIKGWPPVI